MEIDPSLQDCTSPSSGVDARGGDRTVCVAIAVALVWSLLQTPVYEARSEPPLRQTAASQQLLVDPERQINARPAPGADAQQRDPPDRVANRAGRG